MSKKNNSTLLSILKEFLTLYRQQFILLFTLLVAEGVVAALSLLAVVPLADFILDPTLENQSRITSYLLILLEVVKITPSFIVVGLFFVLMNLMKGIMAVVIRFRIIRIKHTVARGLFNDSLKTFFKARWEFYSGSEQGLLLNSLTKELSTIGDTIGHLATFFAQFLQLGIYLAVPLLIDWKMTATAMCLSLLFSVPFLFMNKLSRRLAVQNVETANKMTGVLNETIQAAKIILGFGRQQQARQRYLDAFDAHSYYSLRILALSTAIPKLFAPLGMLAAVFAMSMALGRTPVSELAAVLWSLLAAMPILSALIQGNVSIRYFLPSYEQLLALRKRAAEYGEVEGTIEFKKLSTSISLESCYFTYPGRTSTIIDCNIKIVKGTMTALVGDSGSGKSTIADLILGLQVPHKGKVLIDNVSLDNYKQNSFRERVGYVPQDSILFHTSIRENLLWTFSEASEKDLWDALALANADEFVKSMPLGIDTLVGDRGVLLSGGQRQRIALARALLRKPELLILDEATSSLDTESENLIQKSIEEVAKGTTILVIAHRLSTISKADYIYVLNIGKVLEEGTYDDLRAKVTGKLASMLSTENSN